MSNQVVSIITPSYNRADIIQETADSIFSQTYPHWEWVIVDDGSTDNSWEVLEGYAKKDNRVKIFKRNREPKGAAACRNIAIENATGNYLIFLDTDDVLASFCLQQRVDAAQQDPQFDFIVFPMLLFKRQPDDQGMLWNIDKDEDEVNRLLLGDPLCQGTGTIWKKESFVRVGMWNEKLLLWQDIELHLRSLLQGVTFKKRMDLLPDIFLRISDDSLSRVGYHSLPKLQSRANVFVQTVKSIIEKNKQVDYRKGMRNMGADIITSAIHSNHFLEATNLIIFSSSKGIFTKEESKLLKSYLLNRKYKLYKIPFLGKPIKKKIDLLVPRVNSTLGIIKYTQKINV